MRSSGFTLIELLTTISISAALLTIGIPSFSKQIQNSRVETAMLSLQESLQLTRVSAVSTNKRATISNLKKWEEGWEVFIDLNNNGIREPNEDAIKKYEKLKGIRISTTEPVKTYVSYIGTGEGTKANGKTGGAFQAGTFTICPEAKGAGYELTLARGGRVRKSDITERECEAKR